MIAVLRPQPNARPSASQSLPRLGLLMANLQPLTLPDTLDPLDGAKLFTNQKFRHGVSIVPLRITQFSQSIIKECIERRLNRVVIMTIIGR